MIIFQYGFQVMERTWNCIWNHQGEITQKVWKQELSFLYVTHLHDLFYITMKYHDHIPKGIQVTERTRICIKKHQRGDNSKSIKARALIFVWTHRCDLFYITVKYHQNIPNGIQVIERTWKYLRMDGQTTDGCQAHRYIPEPFSRGIRILMKSLIYSAKIEAVKRHWLCQLDVVIGM